jgi:hypothetical protein
VFHQRLSVVSLAVLLFCFWNVYSPPKCIHNFQITVEYKYIWTHKTNDIEVDCLILITTCRHSKGLHMSIILSKYEIQIKWCKRSKMMIIYSLGKTKFPNFMILETLRSLWKKMMGEDTLGLQKAADQSKGNREA